jgi:ribonucleoside-diphosphate reductase alpha chain
MMRTPYGFPMSPVKWTEEYTETTTTAQNTPGDGTWYNINTATKSVPIGAWKVNYSVYVYGAYASNPILIDVKDFEKYTKEPLKLFDNSKIVDSSPMKLVEENADVYKITLDNGLSHTITDYHQVLVRTSGTFDKKITTENIKCSDLKINDMVAFQTKKGMFGDTDMPDEAFLLGLYQADGTQNKDTIHLCLWEQDFDLLDEVQEKFDFVYKKYNCDSLMDFSRMKKKTSSPKFNESNVGSSPVRKKTLQSPALKRALNFEKGYVPQWIWTANENTQWQYIRGLFYADGTVNVTNGKGNPFYLSITNTNKNFLEELQILLLNLVAYT